LKLGDPRNADVIKSAIAFFSICAFFQIFEAARIALLGSLRALKDTRFTLIASLFGFWFVPLGLFYPLHQLGFGGDSLWLSMTIGAACNALLLHKRYKIKLRHAAYAVKNEI
jgi:MATE family multidrug resistance protein